MWQKKVHKVISELCLESYRQANYKKGKKYKKHKQYSVPDEALDLIECLDTDDEERAKSIMLYDYNVRKVLQK